MQRLQEESLPSRERGLKQFSGSMILKKVSVAPLAGAWIETKKNKRENMHSVSLPSRERGLKPDTYNASNSFVGRSPRGSVD